LGSTFGGFTQTGFCSGSQSLTAYFGSTDANGAALASNHFYYFNGGSNTGSALFDVRANDVIAAEIVLILGI
jgi:hypothetical protein